MQKFRSKKTCDLAWTKKNITADFITIDNYLKRKYTRYIGTFHQDAYSYVTTGLVFGPVDDNRNMQILEEPEYLIDRLE